MIQISLQSSLLESIQDQREISIPLFSIPDLETTLITVISILMAAIPLVLWTFNCTSEGLQVLKPRLHILPRERLITNDRCPFIVIILGTNGVNTEIDRRAPA